LAGHRDKDGRTVSGITQNLIEAGILLFLSGWQEQDGRELRMRKRRRRVRRETGH
jgi:hypothetical protein